MYSENETFHLLENNVLLVMQMVFDLQNTPEWKGIKHVEEDDIAHIFNSNKKRSTESNYFFCEDCDKNICEACFNFMHRNHDVNFVSRDKGSCSHEPLTKKIKPEPVPNRMPVKPDRFVSRYLA